MVLEDVNFPEDVKELSIWDKKILADEIREYILDVVSKNGGHLASSLGVVELTIALHSCFDCPKDKIVWDVGHQTYAHKILTGRKEQMKNLRQFGGVAGFPRSSESEYDCFDAGHSSTSISVALGMARARDILNEKHKVIAVIGDGALTGGMALEALNDAGYSKSDLIVILNDNEMSISKNIGGLSSFLTKLRTKKFYTKSNISGKNLVRKIPFVGDKIVSIVVKIKRGIKQLIIPKMFFEDIGFRYLGPVDGHDIEKLESILNISKTLDGPVLIHVITKKGKGYKFAEEFPDKFHSTSKFDIETGEKLSKGGRDYSSVFGDKLVDLGYKDGKIVAITASMKDGTGLAKFAKEFPDRFFDIGIAEQHAVAMVAGMAKEGLKPVFPVYSSFLQRGYDQLIHDVCLQNLPVTICIDRAGIVGNDGETHQGVFDLSYLNTIPNMNIMAPKNYEELEKMLEFAVNFDSPVAIRYPRGKEDDYEFESCLDIEFGNGELIKQGKDVTICAIGKMVSYAKKAADILEKENISCEVINVRFLKPLDKDLIRNSALKTGVVYTIEDNSICGGLGSSVNDLLENESVKVYNIGYPDCFVKHGSVPEIEKEYGIDVDSIVLKIKNNIEGE
ncbi:MAG: 1-deoxy-D-xylulose-5-phosphate synthase [Clostridia bacterium]|nr:1-deoxy-D-xylulose-5-phosphate synthase [Clostridia bacterium]